MDSSLMNSFPTREFTPQEPPGPDVVLFGTELGKVMRRQSQVGNYIPRYVSMMIKHLRQDLSRKDIFRLMGDAERVHHLHREMDYGRLEGISSQENPVTISKLLKEYMRHLPLETFDYNKFDSLNDIEGLLGVAKRKIQHIHEVVFPKLGRFDIQFLYEVFLLFRDLVRLKRKNSMTPKNLSVCLMLSFFKFRDGESHLSDPVGFIRRCPRYTAVFVFLVEHFDAIFPEGRPELPEGSWYGEMSLLDDREWSDRIEWLLGEDDQRVGSHWNVCVAVSKAQVWRCWASFLIQR